MAEAKALTLTEFLAARIEEDELVARDFVSEEFENPPIERQRWIHARNEWVTLYDPTRALAECETKRRIVAMHPADDSVPGDPSCRGCTGGGWYVAPHPCLTLQLLALPYAEHPDYRQEWKP